MREPSIEPTSWIRSSCTTTSTLSRSGMGFRFVKETQTCTRGLKLTSAMQWEEAPPEKRGVKSYFADKVQAMEQAPVAGFVT